MVSACPTESDPRSNLSRFVSDPKTRSIGGLRSEGLGSLMDLIHAEVLRQSPDALVIDVDRDFLSQHGVLFARDLTSCIIDMTFGRKAAVFITEDIPVNGWQEMLSYLTDDVQVYMGSLACRQVPMCVKLR